MLMGSEVSDVEVRLGLCILEFAVNEGGKYPVDQQSEVYFSDGPHNFIRLF